MSCDRPVLLAGELGRENLPNDRADQRSADPRHGAALTLILAGPFRGDEGPGGRMLHALWARLEALLIREGRLSLAQDCFRFLPARGELDLLGYEDPDILSH